MFSWFKKKENKVQTRETPKDLQDQIEESLWEIKEEYDLPTEEIDSVVETKRKNLKYMRKMLSAAQKYK